MGTRHATAACVFGRGDRRVPVEVFADPACLGLHLASRILDEIAAARAQGRQLLLGCPAGRSLGSTYAALGRRAGAGDLDVSNLVIVMMDEFVVDSPAGPGLCPADAHYSCRGYAQREILGPLQRALPAGRRVAEGALWYPEPQDAAAYDDRIADAGGIDLFLLASGTSDGHVAFNPAGSSLDDRTRVIELSEETRRDNLETFPAFGNLDEVPHLGVSVGLGTIAGLSRSAVLVVTGAGKRTSVSRLARCGDFTREWPVSVIFRCDRPRIALDRLALPDCASPDSGRER